MVKLINDSIFPFLIDNGKVRGRFVRLDKEVRQLLNRHQYPAIVNHYLIEMIAIAACLAVDVKQSGTFTLQITNGNIIKMMVVDISSNGHFRACAKWDTEKLQEFIDKDITTPSLGQLFGGAYMAFTADLIQINDRYQAIVELSGATLSESIHHYFHQSEQIPTAMVVHANTLDSEGALGGALLIQSLPENNNDSLTEDNDDWVTDVCLLSTVTRQELLDKNLSAPDLLHRLFHERNLQIFEDQSLREQCRCSEEKIEEVLRQFSNEDIKSIMIDRKIVVTCDFCSQVYTFDAEKLESFK